MFNVVCRFLILNYFNNKKCFFKNVGHDHLLPIQSSGKKCLTGKDNGFPFPIASHGLRTTRINGPTIFPSKQMNRGLPDLE